VIRIQFRLSNRFSRKEGSGHKCSSAPEKIPVLHLCISKPLDGECISCYVQILEKFGKSWNLKLKFSRPWKVWKMIRGMEKSGKILENYEVDLENMAFHYSFSLHWLILHHAFVLLWSRYGIGQTIIFLPCGYFFLSSFFLSSPDLSRFRLDVCHTSTHGVALVRI